MPTEVETRSQRGRRRAVVTRRLVPLAGGASMPFAGSSHERSRELLEEGQVDYVPVAAPSRKAFSQSRGLSSPGKGKKKVSHSPVQVRRQFEVSSPPVSSRKRTVTDDPNFAAALMTESPRGKTRKSGRDRKAAPTFQGGMP